MSYFEALTGREETLEEMEAASRGENGQALGQNQPAKNSSSAKKPKRQNDDSKNASPAILEPESESSDGKRYVKNPIVWIDLEMTGLDPEKDHILEIACLITDGELTAPHLEGPDIAVHQPDSVLDNMNEWSAKVHAKSGLTQKCKDSKISLEEAETQVLEFMQRHTEAVDSKGLAQHKAHLAGNSVYMDQAFLKKYMPRIFAHLHWRLIDISTLLELARRWYPEEHRRAPKKKVLHTAMADIRESLKELKYYRQYIFKQPGLSYKEYLSAKNNSQQH